MYQEHVAALSHLVPLGEGAQCMPSLPNKSNVCEKQNAWCFALVQHKTWGTSRAVSTVAVHHIALSTGRQEKGSGTGTGSSWPMKSGVGEQGIREKDSSADKTEQPWCLKNQSQLRGAVSQFSLLIAGALPVAVSSEQRNSSSLTHTLPATPAGKGKPAGVGRYRQCPAAATPTAGKGMQANPAGPGMRRQTALHSTSQLLINTAVKPNTSASASSKARTRPPNVSISGCPSNPQFQYQGSPIQVYNSCWFSDVTATARHGIKQFEDLTKWILLLFKPSCNTWKELHMYSSPLPTNTPLTFLHLCLSSSPTQKVQLHIWYLLIPLSALWPVDYKAQDNRPPWVCMDRLQG